MIWHKKISGKSYILDHKNKYESVMIWSQKMTNEIYVEDMSNAVENIIEALYSGC